MRPVLLSYRTLGIGDLLTGVPALRALRAAFPDHEHVLAAPAALAPLIACIDAVDRHLPTDELAPLPREMSSPRLAVNLHGRGPRSHHLLLATRPQRLIAFDHPDIGSAQGAPPWYAHEHEVLRWCRLLDAEGIPADPAALYLRPPRGPAPSAAVGATIVHPGAKSASRRWPPERFAEVARRERLRGRRVLVTGSSAEIELAEHVAGLAGLDRSAMLAGRLDLGALARHVDAAARVVCGDTGVAHLATALGTPSVVLFGPMSPELWGPPADLRDLHRVVWKERDGDPLGDAPDPGLLQISVDDVVVELSALQACGQASPTPALSS